MHRLRRHRHWLARTLFGALLIGWLSAFAGVCQAMATADVQPALHHAGHGAQMPGCCEDAADPCLHANCVHNPAKPALDPQLLAAANLLTVAPPQGEPETAAPLPLSEGIAVDVDRSPPRYPPLHLQYCVFLD